MKLPAQRGKQTASPKANFFGNRGPDPLFIQPLIQPGLRVNPPDDSYEKEADFVADSVMRMPDTPVQRQEEEDEEIVMTPVEEEGEEVVQRKCTECEEEKKEKLQRKPLTGDITPFVQRNGADEMEDSSLIASSLQTGRGRPLPEDTRSWMENRFGTDFSRVKVHTDAQAMQLSCDLNAEAFTHGSNIYFNSGRFAPGTNEGKRLLAHELTHTIQQGGGGGNRIMMFRNPDLSRNGFDTFFIGTSDNPSAFAVQTGRNPGSARVTLTVASQTSGLRNPPVSQRVMPLPIHINQARSPRIIRETENELSNREKQKLIGLELSPDISIPEIVITVRYHRDQAYVPFPGGTFGIWRRVNVESGWIQVTAGIYELTVNFSSEIPGSFHSSRFRISQHPRLGLVYIDNRTNRMYLYPRRPSFASVELERSITRTLIHMLPVVGPLVMIGEAVVGRDIWGRRISTTERAILGVGALLSVAGPLIRGARSTAATVRAVNQVATVGNISRRQALRMVLGARALTGPERTRLTQFAAKIRAGQALTQRELTAFNRILSKFEEPARIASVRAEVQALTGTRTQAGRFTDLSAQTSAQEARAGQILARDLRSDVVRVPESSASGRRVGDFLIDNRTAELYTPRTSNIENLLRGAVNKHQQSGTMVIDISQTTVPQAEILGSTGRLFGRPEFGDVTRLIFMNDSRVITTVLRPATATGSSAAGAAIRGGASVIGQETSD